MTTYDECPAAVSDALRFLLDRLHTSGACVGTDVPQKWFPLPGFTDAEYDAHATWACHECPVRGVCLTVAVKTGQTQGVWGGLAEHHLRVLADATDPDTSQVRGHPATGIDTSSGS